MNYNPEITAYIIKEYCAVPTRETVNRLGLEIGKTPKSVIGKLSREGVYRCQVYKTKQGKVPITKLEIVATIAEELGFSPDELKGLDKTPKLILLKLQEVIIQ